MIKLVASVDRPPAYEPYPSAPSGSEPGTVQDMAPDDVLQYVHEMAVALSYMAAAQDCERLSALLGAAAAEAQHQAEAVRTDTRLAP